MSNELFLKIPVLSFQTPQDFNFPLMFRHVLQGAGAFFCGGLLGGGLCSACGSGVCRFFGLAGNFGLL